MNQSGWLISVLYSRRSAVCSLLLATCYLLTLPPTLSWAHYGADGGDLATAIAYGRLPHPPGFPTYLLLGAAFIQVPWGDPAARLNLFSALSAAVAAGLTAAAVRRLSSSVAVAVVAGLCLGLAPLFWSQALITEVYAPAALFSAALLFLACSTDCRPATAAGLLGILWGLGIGVHPTLLFLAPLTLGRSLRPASDATLASCIPVSGSLASCILAALLTVGLLYGPVLLAWGKAPSPWVSLDNPADWWAYVSGRLYHHYVFALPAPFWPQRLLAWLGLLARQFTPIGVLLAGWGWERLWREHRPLALSTALTFGLFSLYAMGYHTADSLVYLVPALPVAALWLGLGLHRAAEWLRTRRAVAVHLLWLLPLLQLALFWRSTDIHDDRSAIRWAQEKLESAPPRAILLTAQDAHTFALWYACDVLGIRPDIVVVDRDLWGHPPYRRMLTASLGEAILNPALSPYEAGQASDRPIVEVTDDP